MQDQHHLTLIDGRFSADEARKLLSGLLSQKISFHQLEKFSHTERFGRDLLNSEKRVKELMEVNQQIQEIVKYAAAQGFLLKIQSHIEILLVDEGPMPVNDES